MADNFAARQCNRYTVVCTAPDVCWTPKKRHGKPIPYMSSISLDNAVTVAKKTHFNGNKAFMYDQSITPNIDGDMAGKGKGIVSKTHYTKGKCIPTSSSPNVYIEAKLLVLENGTFDMNVGDAGANTVGCLTCTDSGDSAQITAEGKIKQSKEGQGIMDWLYENSGLKGVMEDLKAEQMAKHQADVDFRRGMATGDNALISDAITRGNAFREADNPFVDIGDTVIDTAEALKNKDLPGAAMAMVGGITSTAAKRFPGGKQIIKKVEKKFSGGGKILGTGDCSALVLKMDCGGYPTDKVPMFNLDESPQQLKISVEKRCDRNKTGEPLYKNFGEYFEKGVTGDTRRFMAEKFTLTDKELSSGKAALKVIKSQGKAINMHHILPGWAGGKDDGSNLAPVLNPKTGGDHRAAHKWWSNKAKAGRDDLVKKAKSCDSKDKKDKKKKKKPNRVACLKNKTKKNGDFTYKALAECQLTSIAKCLKKEGSTFTLEIDCPSATP